MWIIDSALRTEVERAIFAAGHSLWIGGVLGILLWALLRVTPAKRTALRYAMALGALALVAISLPATYTALAMKETPHAEMTATLAGQSESQAIPPADRPKLSASPEQPGLIATGGRIDWIPIAAGLWAAGFAVMMLRMAVHLRGARRLMARCQDASQSTVGEQVRRLLERLQWRRNIRVMVAAGLSSPAVVGFLRPVLLIPAAIACELTPQQLESILLHELAHIRRHDYLVNVGQMLIEALLFFSPAVWFISRQIRIEREACCDAFAAHATGEPLRYAEALSAVMSRLGNLPTAMALMGQGKATLLDRVRRLLVPGYRPGLRLSVPMLICTVVAGLLLFAGLWRTTDKAVVAVADWMSDAERVEKIAQVQEEVQKAEAADGTATVAGQIVTEDGSPLPAIRRVIVNVSSKASTVFSQLDATNGRFRGDTKSGGTVVGVQAVGYAPAVWGPQILKPGDRREDIKLVLKRGVTAQVTITEPDGKPVAKAEISVAHVLRYADGSTWLGASKLTTDAAGTLVIPAIGELPMRLEAKLPGYQALSAEFNLSDGKGRTWHLQRAKAISGRVTAEADGKPVQNARIVKMFERGASSGSWHPLKDEAPLLARTDAQGQFIIDTLNDASIYSLAVVADGYTPALIYDFTTSKGSLDIALAPSLHIRGKVIGTPEQLGKLLLRDGTMQLPWASTVRVAHNYRSGDVMYAPARVAGNEAIFEITGFIPGTIDVGSSPRLVRVDATKNFDDLVIDLRADSPNQKPNRVREVQLRFKVPAGAPPVHGMVDIIADNPKTNTDRQKMAMKVENGAVTFVSIVGKPFRYEGGGLAGYWFGRSPFEPELVLPEGDGPYVVEIEARPAGAAHGIVYDADGKPVAGASISLITVDRTIDRPLGFPAVQSVTTGPDGKYLITPAILGGTYRVGASGQTSRVGDQRVIGEPFTVTGAQPLAQSDLHFVKGVNLSVMVVDEAGTPLPLVDIAPTFNTPWSYSFGAADRRTDGQGRFTIRNLSANWPGTVSVRVQPLRDLAATNVRLKISPEEQTIVLARGVSFSGQITDHQTGRPVPLVNVRFAPKVAVASTPLVEIQSNDKGEFTISTLKGVEYSIYIDDCYPPGTTFELAATGSYRVIGSQEFDPIDPRKESRRDFKVVVSPHHGNR